MSVVIINTIVLFADESYSSFSGMILTYLILLYRLKIIRMNSIIYNNK